MSSDFEVTNIKLFNSDELVARLRNVSMLQDPTVFPYKNADINISDIEVDMLVPAQQYVLESEFEKVRALRWSFLEQTKIDILQLGLSRVLDNGQVTVVPYGKMVGFAEFDVVNKNSGATDKVTILPPIVEYQAESNGKINNLINDGMHRVYLARVCHTKPSVVRISNVPTELPYYAYPLCGGWNSVKLVQSLGECPLKKYHRFPYPLYKKYYRNFNSAFINVGGPRGK